MGTTSNNHAPALSPTQDLKCTLCESTNKLKMVIEKNGHVIFLKYFPQINKLLLYLPTIQIKLHTLLPLGEKAPTPTSEGSLITTVASMAL
jgi:hypothetical protein